ncbi:hypothetical protein A0H81_01070 [Grifola frondosa]|uniref:Uncharacterized protein n=1 Tax=Grifola frondosa TaxID=5627 RepID=A0A1C7MS10_GRIFR|nr:hypothetical protein A0H81_01070 [Grifola frondosa]
MTGIDSIHLRVCGTLAAILVIWETFKQSTTWKHDKPQGNAASRIVTSSLVDGLQPTVRSSSGSSQNSSSVVSSSGGATNTLPSPPVASSFTVLGSGVPSTTSRASTSGSESGILSTGPSSQSQSGPQSSASPALSSTVTDSSISVDSANPATSVITSSSVQSSSAIVSSSSSVSVSTAASAQSTTSSVTTSSVVSSDTTEISKASPNLPAAPTAPAVTFSSQADISLTSSAATGPPSVLSTSGIQTGLTSQSATSPSSAGTATQMASGQNVSTTATADGADSQSTSLSTSSAITQSSLSTSSLATESSSISTTISTTDSLSAATSSVQSSSSLLSTTQSSIPAAHDTPPVLPPPDTSSVSATSTVQVSQSSSQSSSQVISSSQNLPNPPAPTSPTTVAQQASTTAQAGIARIRFDYVQSDNAASSTSLIAQSTVISTSEARSVPSVVIPPSLTLTPNSQASSIPCYNQTDTKTGFFANSGAVAGVFLVVGSISWSLTCTLDHPSAPPPPLFPQHHLLRCQSQTTFDDPPNAQIAILRAVRPRPYAPSAGPPTAPDDGTESVQCTRSPTDIRMTCSACTRQRTTGSLRKLPTSASPTAECDWLAITSDQLLEAPRSHSAQGPSTPGPVLPYTPHHCPPRDEETATHTRTPVRVEIRTQSQKNTLPLLPSKTTGTGHPRADCADAAAGATGAAEATRGAPGSRSGTASRSCGAHAVLCAGAERRRAEARESFWRPDAGAAGGERSAEFLYETQ